MSNSAPQVNQPRLFDIDLILGDGAHVEGPDEGLRFVGPFEVRFSRKKRSRRARIRVVPPDGHIEASVPYNMRYADVEAFILEQADWIRAQQEKLRGSPQVLAELAGDDEKKLWRDVVAASVPLLVELYEPILGVKAGKLAYRDMRSRWGSCQPSTGRICINTRLALYPPECLEYVVVHELCHLREPGHGPRFKQLLDEVLPDWRHSRDLLR